MIFSYTKFFSHQISSITTLGKFRRRFSLDSEYYQAFSTLPGHVRFFQTMNFDTKFKDRALSGRKMEGTPQRKQRNQTKLDPAAASHAASRINVSVIGTGCRGTPRAVLIQSIFSKCVIGINIL